MIPERRTLYARLPIGLAQESLQRLSAVVHLGETGRIQADRVSQEVGEMLDQFHQRESPAEHIANHVPWVERVSPRDVCSWIGEDVCGSKCR